MIKPLLYNIGLRLGYKIKKVRPNASTTYALNRFGTERVTACEIGVWRGENALSILQNLNIKKLYLIDPWENYSDYSEIKGQRGEWAYRDTLNRLREYHDQIKVLRLRSSHGPKFIMEQLDFVYIDGNHSYDYVLQDLRNYWPLVKKGGFLAGDDFNIKGVAEAVITFTRENNLIYKTNILGGVDDVDFIIDK